MNTPQRAALLVRISEDKAGDSAGIGRQETDARGVAARLGWGVSEVFVENDTSAFKRRRVTLPDGSTAMRVLRPEFRRLLDQIASGETDGLIAYHLDRVARDPRDLEDLIDVVERARIPVETVTGSLRLATDADITMARIGVAIANQSSRDASRRIKRKHDELAEQGRYAGGGARRYGFEQDGVTIREDEAKVLREAAQRVIDGEAVTAIARDLDRRGIKPVRAARWSGKTLTDQLKGGRIAGLRVHRGEIVGTAQWPAILDRATWEAVCAVLASRAQGKVRRELVHWLNGLLFCGHCGLALSASRQVDGRHRYWCNTYRANGCGRIAIGGAGAEQEVTRQVLEYLSRPDVVQSLSSATASSAASRARADIAEDEAQLKQLARMWAEKQISLTEYAEARSIIEQRLGDARSLVRQHLPRQVEGVFGSTDPAAAWERLTPTNKREAVRAILGANGHRGWTVAPADLTKPRRFDPERMQLASL